MLSVRRRPYRYGALLLFFLTIFTLAHRYVEARLGFPSYLHLVEGQSEYFRVGLPVTLSVSRLEEGGEILFNHRPGRGLLVLKRQEILALTPLRQGRVRVTVRLFGLIPLQERVLDVVPPVKVVPGGHSIGVLLAPQGLIVSGFSPLPGPGGKAVYPAREAGLKVGDLVTHLDGEVIYSVEQVGRLVDRCGREGRPVRIQVRRGQRFLVFRVRPVRLEDRRVGNAEVYRIGVFLDDPAAGVGTLTFYEPATRIFGALGHMVANFSGREGPGMIDGRIVPATVAGIHPGNRGQPGEKVGIFHQQAEVVGRIEKNTPFGIYGRLEKFPLRFPFQVPVPVAMAHEIREGPAEMWTVISGEQIQRFQIEITKVNRQFRPDGRGLVIQVTDRQLLQRTGGIVQGMSGSPILQGGKIVGAVTHVFVNDPARGYGILAEWMLEEAGLFKGSRPQERSGFFGLPARAAGMWYKKRGKEILL